MPRPLNPENTESFLTIRIPMELRLRLDKVAKLEDRSAGAVARRAIEAYVAEVEKVHG